MTAACRVGVVAAAEEVERTQIVLFCGDGYGQCLLEVEWGEEKEEEIVICRDNFGASDFVEMDVQLR
jgi:hypothetical protein